MYRLFRVTNRQNGVWIAAPDENAARDYAFTKFKLVRRRENIKKCVDVTDAMLAKDTAANQLRALLENQVSPGHLCKQISGMNGTEFMKFLQTGIQPPKPADRWLITNIA